MFKKSLFCIIGCAFIVLIVLIIVAIKQSKVVWRDPALLMNQYYRLKNSHPDAAKRALRIILSQDPHNVRALQELAWVSIDTKNNARYSNEFFKIQPLSLNYGALKNLWQLASLSGRVYLGHEAVPVQGLFPLKKVSTKDKFSLPQDSVQTPKPTIKSFKGASLGKKQLRRTLDVKRPHCWQTFTLKERGYRAIKAGLKYRAIRYFTQAYQQCPEPSLAMQLGYLYDQCGNKPTAYRYFQKVAKASQPGLAFEANNAMTNLSEQQIKALPSPYFSETFFTPFSQSRFGLTVRPFLTRFGIEQKNRVKSREYVLFRRTDDNRSTSFGEISQIYEDDVQIIGVGAQMNPIQGIPIVGFVEAGGAYDLVYRYRKPWRGDLRAGVMYYDQFGTLPAYYGTWTWGCNYFGDLYADVTYFSRYNNNVIGGARTHQGIRALQYHSSMVNLYVTGRVIADVQRLFYNNFVEVGPGVAFVPTNRFNLQLRFEHLNGMYLPAGGIPNPYGQYYTNNLVQLLFYARV